MFIAIGVPWNPFKEPLGTFADDFGEPLGCRRGPEGDAESLWEQFSSTFKILYELEQCFDICFHSSFESVLASIWE